MMTFAREADFRTFAHWHRASGDIDPVYPVLTAIAPQVCDDDDEVVSLVLLYVAYYDLGSALTAWVGGWRPGKELSDIALRRATGTERRAHRTIPRFVEHIAALGALHRHYGSWDKALFPHDLDPAEAWLQLQGRLAAIRGNGRWAAYKTGEMLMSVAGWPLRPTDAGHAWSSGPRKGLVDLYPELVDVRGNDPRTIALLDEATNDIVEALGHPVEQVETALCDWHSMMTGHYYVGHDIDLMLQQLGRAPLPVQRMISAARREAFEWRWLGEVQGWTGVRKHLLSRYRKLGNIQWWGSDA